MEKIGDPLNQMAIICDLLENINLEASDKTIIFQVEEKEFTRIYGLISEKAKITTFDVKDTFNIKIGEIDVIFNKNSV